MAERTRYTYVAALAIAGAGATLALASDFEDLLSINHDDGHRVVEFQAMLKRGRIDVRGVGLGFFVDLRISSGELVDYFIIKNPADSPAYEYIVYENAGCLRMAVAKHEGLGGLEEGIVMSFDRIDSIEASVIAADHERSLILAQIDGFEFNDDLVVCRDRSKMDNSQQMAEARELLYKFMKTEGYLFGVL